MSTLSLVCVTAFFDGRGFASFVDHLRYFCLVLLCFHARLFADALWSPAGKGLTSWLSFVMSYCDVVTFPLVSCVRCGAWLYRFLIFALFLTLLSISSTDRVQLVKKLINLEPHSIFGSNFAYLFILTLSSHCYAKHRVSFRLVKI